MSCTLGTNALVATQIPASISCPGQHRNCRPCLSLSNRAKARGSAKPDLARFSPFGEDESRKLFASAKSHNQCESVSWAQTKGNTKNTNQHGSGRQSQAVQ